MRKLLLAVTMAVVLLIATATAKKMQPYEKVAYAEKYISAFYVDSVDEDKLVEDAIKGMLKELDPHSSYSSPEETKALNEPLEGSFTGIGITYNMGTDTVYVIETVSGGPCEKVGILPGDRFLAVNDTIIAGKKLKNTDIQKKLRGPKGSKVDIKVLRPSAGAFDTIDFRVTRDVIPIYSVDAAYMVSPSTGYIRLNKFAADSRDEVVKELKDLKKKGMKNLILDLTDNGGGYLNAAKEILGELLPSGSLAVYTEGLNSVRQNLHAFPKGKTPLLEDGRLVIMVNQYSASASEITAGAIQDYDRGVIVGRRTFGKGLVQRPIPFDDGSMIRLTTAHYYTPSGRDIQKPYTKGEADAYNQDIVNRLNSGELMHEDSIHHDEALRKKTLINQRTVYGGGGISPDVFVPLDTTWNTKYYRNVVAKGLVNKYVVGYVDEHRKEIKKKYGNSDNFVEYFEVTDDMLETLRELAEKEGVEYDADQASISTPLFKMQMKALIGRDIFDGATYYKVYNKFDDIFKKALEVIESDDYYDLLQ